MPERLKLRFYLPEPENVHLTVRELENYNDYWMDEVRPGETWPRGFDNEFQWSTEVLRQINRQFRVRIDVYDLGVVALVGQEKQTGRNTVAPVILYHNNPPSSVDTFVHDGLTNDFVHYYSAFTYNGSEYSVATFASAMPADTAGPGPVTGFALAAGDERIDLSWTNPAAGDFDETEVRWSTSGFPAHPDDGTKLGTYPEAPGSIGGTPRRGHRPSLRPLVTGGRTGGPGGRWP